MQLDAEMWNLNRILRHQHAVQTSEGENAAMRGGALETAKRLPSNKRRRPALVGAMLLARFPDCLSSPLSRLRRSAAAMCCFRLSRSTEAWLG